MCKEYVMLEHSKSNIKIITDVKVKVENRFSMVYKYRYTPLRMHPTGYTACPMNGSVFGPRKSASSTWNLRRATSGHWISNVNVWPQIGLRPFDAEMMFITKFYTKTMIVIKNDFRRYSDLELLRYWSRKIYLNCSFCYFKTFDSYLWKWLMHDINSINYSLKN